MIKALFMLVVLMQGPMLPGPGLGTGAATSTITFDAKAVSAAVTSGTTISWSHTVGVGTHTILFVSVGGNGGGIPTTTCTYNSVAMTVLPSKKDSGTANGTIVFILAAPSTGANTVSCTYGATIASAAGQSASFFGVNQSTPNRTCQTANDASGGAGTVSPTSVVVSNAVSGDLVVDSATVTSSGALTAGGAQILLNSKTNIGGNLVSWGSSYIAASGSTTMNWTFSGTHNWAAIGCALIPG